MHFCASQLHHGGKRNRENKEVKIIPFLLNYEHLGKEKKINGGKSERGKMKTEKVGDGKDVWGAVDRKVENTRRREEKRNCPPPHSP